MMNNNHLQGSTTLSNKEQFKKQQQQPQQPAPVSSNPLPPNNFLKSGNQILFTQTASPQAKPLAQANSDSAVKGRRLGQQELNVVCGVSQQDTLRNMEMVSSYNGPGFKQLLSAGGFEPNQLQSQQANNQLQNSSKRDRSEKLREGAKNANTHKSNKQHSSETHTSGGSGNTNNNNAFRTRKSSTDSHGGANRQARFNSSQGRSDKKRGAAKSTSNSQSRGVSGGTANSKNPHDQRIAGLNYQGKTGNAALSNSLKRPSSAKNLKNAPSGAIMTGKNHLVSSPTQTNLRREMSINQLPPKNPGGASSKNSKNQNAGPLGFSKASMPLYQSVGAHPLSGHSQSQQSNSNSSKRVPSAGSERKIFDPGFASLASSMNGNQLRMQRMSQPLNNNYVSQQQQDQPTGEKSAPFSPVRNQHNRFHHDSAATLPTSGSKPGFLYSGEKNSHSRGKNRKLKNQQSNGKLKSPGGLLAPNFTSDSQQNLLTFSPNLGRIRADQVISEEQKEDSFNRYEAFNPQIPLSSFDSNEYQNMLAHSGQQNSNAQAMNIFNIQFDPAQSTPNLLRGFNELVMSSADNDPHSLYEGMQQHPGTSASHAVLPSSNLANTASLKLLQSDPALQREIQRTLREHLNQKDDKRRKKLQPKASMPQTIREGNLFQGTATSGKENVNKGPYGQTASPNEKAQHPMELNRQLNSVQSQQQLLRQGPRRMNQEQMKQLLEQRLQAAKLGQAKNLRKQPTALSTQALLSSAQPHSRQQQDMVSEQHRRELLEQKQRRQQSREQHNRQREEMHEIRAIMHDALKDLQPSLSQKSQQQSNSQTRQQKGETSKVQRPFSAKVGGAQLHDQVNQNHQVHIKMPPVQMEGGGASSPYEVMQQQYLNEENQELQSLSSLSNLNHPLLSDASPLRTHKYDHATRAPNPHQTLMSVGSEFNLKLNEQQQTLMSSLTDLQQPRGLKTGKREKSRKPKRELEANLFGAGLGQQSAKALNAQLLKQKIEMKFDDYKSKLSQQLNRNKLKKGSKGMKSQKVLDQQPCAQGAMFPSQGQTLTVITPQSVSSGANEERLNRRAMQHRSKSRKRLDEEKENKRLSNSPSRDGTQGARLGSKEARSGTKSRSEKKRRRKQQQMHSGQNGSSQEDNNRVTDAQYQNMKQNVIELLQKQNFIDQAQKLMRSSLERSNLPTGSSKAQPSLSKNLKSQTVANLHLALQEGPQKRNQIQITKSMLKNLQMRKMSGKSSQANSNYEGDRSSQQQQPLELSRNQIEQQQQFVNFYPQQFADNGFSVSTPNLHEPQLLLLNQQQQVANFEQHQRLMYMSTDSNQHLPTGIQEMTPVMQSKSQKRKKQINHQQQQQQLQANFDQPHNLLFSSQQLQKMALENQSTGTLSNKNAQGLRPIDSLQSLHHGNQLGSLSQSREDSNIFRSQDNNMMRGQNQQQQQQLIRIDPSNPQQLLQPFEYRSLSSLNLYPQQPAGSKGIRSRSGSVEHQSSTGNGVHGQKQLKSNKKKKSNKKGKQPEQQFMKRATEMQPQQLNLVSPAKGSGLGERRDNSGSKTRKSGGALSGVPSTASIQRKGSAGYKRNQAAQIQSSQQQYFLQQPLLPMSQIGSMASTVPQSIPTSVTNKQLNKQQIAFSGTNSAKQAGNFQTATLRPKSAAVQSSATIPQLQQNFQKQQFVGVSDQFQMAKMLNEAIITVQKNLKRYLARARVAQMLSEKDQVERDLQSVQAKYFWAQQLTAQAKGGSSLVRSSIESQKSNKGPIKQLFTNEQQNLLQFNNNIQILDEESKGEPHLVQSNNLVVISKNDPIRQSQDSQKSKLTSSEQNLKALLAKETQKLKQMQQLSAQNSQKPSRPQSSEVHKNLQSIPQSKVPRIGSAGANQSKSSALNAQGLVSEAAQSEKSSQQPGVSVPHQQLQVMSSSQGFKMQERRGSQQSAATTGSQKQVLNQQQRQKQQQQEEAKQSIQNKILESEIPQISRNLNDQFDSMASINKLSEELNFRKEGGNMMMLQEASNNKHDSFLKSLILNESYQQNHLAQQRPQQTQPVQAKPQQPAKKPVQPTLSDQQPAGLPLSQGGFNTSSHIMGSDERDISWQFERRSFQDQYLMPLPHMTMGHTAAPADQSKSHILQEESKRQTIEAIQASGQNSRILQQQQQQIPAILSEYEQQLSELEKKAEQGKQELRKYEDKMYLSPASQKKKSQLEKWVEKQEQKIMSKRHTNDNVNDLISKMQMEMDLTKRKINSGSVANAASSARKDSNTSLLRFNVSHEVSQMDMSLSNISLNATPRVQGAHPSAAVGANRSQSVDQQNSKLSAAAPNSRKLFDYKLAAAATGNNSSTAKQSHPALQLGDQFKTQAKQQQENLAKSNKDSSANSSTLAREQQSQKSKSSSQQNQINQVSAKRSLKSERSELQNRSMNSDILNKQKSLGTERKLLRSSDLAAPGLDMHGLESRSMQEEDPNERSNIFKNDTSESRSPHTFSKTVKPEDLGRQIELIGKQTSHGAQSQHHSISQRLRESDIITCSAADDTYPVDDDQLGMGGEEDQENESLSKMEPPQFQSPTMSAISPTQQMRDYFSEEDDKNAPPVHPGQLGSLRPFNINKFIANSSQHELEVEEQEGEEQKQKAVKNSASQKISSLLGGNGAGLVSQVNFSGSDSEREYTQAFLALKEPEHPITLEKARRVKEEKEEREMQTEMLTDYILTLLVEQMRHSLFPKRPVIMKSPVKGGSAHGDDSHYLEGGAPAAHDLLHNIIDEDIRQDDLSSHSLVSSLRSDRLAQESGDTGNSQKPLEPSMFDADRSPSAEDSPTQHLNQALSLLGGQSPSMAGPKKKKVRGIRTQMRVVDQYVQQVFGKVKEGEDEFVENLSTPLNKDPLEILLHLQNAVFEGEIETAVAFQQSVLPVDLYLDIERKKEDVQAQEAQSDEESADVVMNRSMMGEWENIHNKVIFDGINEALDNFRPYGLRGPPMPWSQQTRTLTYKNGQQVDLVLKQVRMKVMEWARTFAGALPCSELLQEYGIKGPLDEDKLTLLREERLALVLAAEIEENEQLWTDYEYEETQSKLDVADMILEFLAEEVARDFNNIQQSRLAMQGETSITADTTEVGTSNLQ